MENYQSNTTILRLQGWFCKCMPELELYIFFLYINENDKKAVVLLLKRTQYLDKVTNKSYEIQCMFHNKAFDAP